MAAGARHAPIFLYFLQIILLGRNPVHDVLRKYPKWQHNEERSHRKEKAKDIEDEWVRPLSAEESSRTKKNVIDCEIHNTSHIRDKTPARYMFANSFGCRDSVAEDKRNQHTGDD